MAQFLSSIETHGAPSLPPASALEIEALCTALQNTIISPTKNILQAVIQKLLLENDPDTCYRLGTLHELGLYNLTKDAAKAMLYFEFAAAQSHVQSLTALASLYADMADQSLDDSKRSYQASAKKYFLLASNAGSDDGTYNLGVMAAAQNEQAEALSYWQQSACNRHMPSLSALIDYYCALKQYVSAVPYLEIATFQLKDQHSQCLLATLLAGGIGHVERDETRAIELFTPLVKHGKTSDIVLTAATNLGQIFVNQGQFDKGKENYLIAAAIAPEGAPAKALIRMQTIETYLEMEAEEEKKRQVVRTKLLGERKVEGRRCSSCMQFGYKSKSWMYCKCKRTACCCVNCQHTFAPKHAAACRKYIRQQQQQSKKKY